MKTSVINPEKLSEQRRPSREKTRTTDRLEHSEPNSGEKVNLVNQVNVTINTSEKEEVTSHAKGTQFQLLYKAVNDFKDGHFILVAGQVERKKYMEDLALVPWSVVFDLDQNSRKEGLLSVVEDKLESHRSLYFHTLLDKFTTITDTSTHWVSIRGSYDNPDSMKTDDIRSWNKNKDVNAGLTRILQNISNFSEYTKFRIIVLWPSDLFTPEYVHSLLQQLDKWIDAPIIIIDDNEPKPREAMSILSTTKRYFVGNLTHVYLNLEELSKVVQRCLDHNKSTSSRQYQLPTSNQAENIEIDHHRASWLKEHMDILFLDKQHDSNQKSGDILREECDNFYKGGTLPWWMWYELGAGHVDAERDIMDSMLCDIRKDIKIYKSSTFTLNHAPGSGGTTLAQRILWELRKEVPCVQAKVRSGYSVNEVQNRLEFIYKITDLPILLLLDGEEEQRLDELVKEVGHMAVIALCVKRYPYPMEWKGLHKGRFWLPGYVSPKEANVIALKFQQQCKDNKKIEHIHKLNNDVQLGKQRMIFEFGLAAYTYEYKGIEAYVKGFLQLEKTVEHLEPWQIALGMLSLTYYYGQTGITCLFFEKMLNIVDSNRVATIKDFPKYMQNLIVQDTQEGKQNMTRISHFYIAKEILEQILPWPNERSSTRNENLCLEKKIDLERFAIQFIQEAASRNKTPSQGFMIPMMMTRTFISRDFKPLGERENVKEKRREFISHLLIDLENRPPFTARFNVLEQLANSFPDQPPFWAHLGRLYMLFKPEMEKEAERCFKEALALCESKTKGKQLDAISRTTRLTMMTTNHMYGQMFQKRIEKITGKRFGDRPEHTTDLKNFPETAEFLLQDVRSACQCFQECRLYNPNVQEDLNAFRGEIFIRLMFCDFVQKRGGCKSIDAFIRKNDQSEISMFVQECIHEIDDLFLECFSSLDPEEIGESLITYQRWYTAIFKKSTSGYLTPSGNSIQDRRIYIAQLKLQAGSDFIYGVLENIDSEVKILKIIKAYEQNFQEATSRDIKFSKRVLDLDYKEWLVAIRHKSIEQPYKIETVLEYVQTWYDTLKTPQSRFYLFILKSLLGFGTKTQPGNTLMLIEAQELREDVMKQTKYVAKFKHPREWLGTADGICRLEQGTKHFGQFNRALDSQNLEVMQGTICHPNKNPRSGTIDLDIGYGNKVAVKLFFLPLKAQMAGPSYVGKRVEFSIAFSFFNGYEAFDLKALEKKICPKCGIKLEVSSRDKTKECPKPCGNIIHCT